MKFAALTFDNLTSVCVPEDIFGARRIAWFPSSPGSLVDIIGKHVPECDRHGLGAAYILHEGDFALLLVTNRMRHDAQARIALAMPHLVSHLHGTLVMQRHRRDEKRVELVWNSPGDLGHLGGREEVRHI